MPGAALNPEDKVRIARALVAAGITSLDAGFPACAPSEIDALQRIVREVPEASVSALCRTLPADIDKAWEALSEAPPDRCAVSLFVGTSPIHREHKLHRGVADLLRMVRDCIDYARQRFENVAFSAEDGSRTEPEVLCALYREAIDAGARAIGFADTVGILLPHQVREFVACIQDHVPNLDRAVLVGHFHNDLGLATANTLAALQAGMPAVQCTVNGIGERAGNTSLEEVVLAITLHGDDLGLRTKVDTRKLWDLSRLVAELTGTRVAVNKAVVGDNVFATEAGIHQDGLLKHPDTYLPFRPELVGAPGVRLAVGKHSGRAAVHERLSQLGLTVSDDELERIADLVKSASKEDLSNEAAFLRSAAAAVRAGTGA